MSGRAAARDLRSWCENFLLGHGVSREQAISVAANLVWCECAGRANFGLQRLPILVKRLKAGVLNGQAAPRAESLGPALARLDGDNGFGHFAAERAMDRAVELARANGIAAAGVRNSNFLGACAYYAKRAADRGMIGFAFSNSFPKVAAHGGTRPVLGTNPFAVGAPRRNGEHMLIDMATSAHAGSTVRAHAEAGTRPAAGLAADGTLLPFGGAKGYALALMVELLAGVITGAGSSSGVASMYNDFSRGGDNGHLMIAIDIARFMPMPDYFARFETLAAALKASGGDVLLPGEIRWRSIAESEASGIAIAGETARLLRPLSAEIGLETPF